MYLTSLSKTALRQKSDTEIFARRALLMIAILSCGDTRNISRVSLFGLLLMSISPFIFLRSRNLFAYAGTVYDKKDACHTQRV